MRSASDGVCTALWCCVAPRGCAWRLDAVSVESVNYRGTSKTASNRLLTALADNSNVAITPADDLVSLVRAQPPDCIWRQHTCCVEMHRNAWPLPFDQLASARCACVHETPQGRGDSPVQGVSGFTSMGLCRQAGAGTGRAIHRCNRYKYILHTRPASSVRPSALP